MAGVENSNEVKYIVMEGDVSLDGQHSVQYTHVLQNCTLAVSTNMSIYNSSYN